MAINAYEIFLSTNLLMQFYMLDSGERILIKIVDGEANCCITLWHDQVLKLISQIKRLDEINISHPTSWKQESYLFCNAFHIQRHVCSSKIVIITANDKISLDDVAIKNLGLLEFNFKSIIQGLQSKKMCNGSTSK